MSVSVHTAGLCAQACIGRAAGVTQKAGVSSQVSCLCWGGAGGELLLTGLKRLGTGGPATPSLCGSCPAHSLEELGSWQGSAF